MTIEFERVNQPAAVAKGMRVFTLLWLGLMISEVGSGLTSFALDVWVYQRLSHPICPAHDLYSLTACIDFPHRGNAGGPLEPPLDYVDE